MTDREQEAIKTLAEILKGGWGDEDLDCLAIRLKAHLILEGYDYVETDKAIRYFFGE